MADHSSESSLRARGTPSARRRARPLGLWPGLTRTWEILSRRRGDRRWDLLLRATGLAAASGIALTLILPKAIPLVWLTVVGLAVNSPLSPVFPTFFEPIIVQAGKYAPALWVAVVALGVCVYTEYLNWHVYRWVLGWKNLAPLRDRRWVQASVRGFARWPFVTVTIFAFTPLPFWVARCLAVLHEYPLRRYLWSTAIGRFPRYFAYAWLGAALQIHELLLLAFMVGGTLVVGTARWLSVRKSRHGQAHQLPDARKEPLAGSTPPR